MAEFLRSNPDLLAQVELTNAYYDWHAQEADVLSPQMRDWWNASMTEPGFQARLVAWYEQESA